MNGRKNILITSGFVLSVSFFAAAMTVWLVSYRYSRFSFDLLNAVCYEITEQEPETQKIIAAALKEYTQGFLFSFSFFYIGTGWKIAESKT